MEQKTATLSLTNVRTTATPTLEAELMERGFGLVRDNRKFYYRELCRKVSPDLTLRVALHYEYEGQQMRISTTFMQVNGVIQGPFSGAKLLRRVDECVEMELSGATA